MPPVVYQCAACQDVKQRPHKQGIEAYEYQCSDYRFGHVFPLVTDADNALLAALGCLNLNIYAASFHAGMDDICV